MFATGLLFGRFGIGRTVGVGEIYLFAGNCGFIL
jgi:hypothetical protein